MVAEIYPKTPLDIGETKKQILFGGARVNRFLQDVALGKEVDQGTLLRFLAEMAWFPQAAISPYLKWESVDDTSARVNMDYKGVSASGIYSFNRDGLVEAFEARRYGDFGGIYRKENWHIAVTGYKTFNGVRVGNANQVTWKLREGDFTWLEIYLTSIEPAAR